MYTYTTAQFKLQAQQHNIQAQIDKLIRTIRQQGQMAVEGLFERNYPYLKRRINYNLRLVGKVVKLATHDVLCLLAVFTRGGKAYAAFLQNPEQYGQKHLDSLINHHQLEASIEAQWQVKHSSAPPLALPDDLYYRWLEPPSWTKNTDDTIICESPVWVNQFKQLEIQQHWQTYYEIINYLVEEPDQQEGIICTATNWQNIHLCGKPKEQYYVLFSRLETADSSHRQVLFLLSLFLQMPSLEEIAEVGNQTHLLNRGQSQSILAEKITFNDLSRYARRAYPDYFIVDSDIWLELEQEKGINLALSVEEEEILHHLSTPIEHQSLPVFINGRAGSGKSTMLIYLFADYCDRYQKAVSEKTENKTIYSPLFLTENKRLLERAKSGVKRLLKNHHKFLGEHSEHLELSSIDVCFQSLKPFLLNQLPSEFIDQFDPDFYLSFDSFSQELQRRHSRYSPELCWHIIRTFIKGYRLNQGQGEYMTPEEYKNISRREQTIAPERFQSIYQKVWPWYHQLTSHHGYWDDQDLIRKVLELQCYQSKYTAIFCDEAQDFTRLELQLIMQLSVFSQYELTPPIQSLPFAFAGDPFQTLNPTGFCWKSAGSTFFDQVISTLDPSGRLNITPTFHELKSNYRSSAAIVKFTNLIHLWRQILFQIPNLEPQEAWQSHTLTPEPQKFIFNQGKFSGEVLKQHLQKSPIFIVPCPVGGELQYVQNDPFLASLFPDASLDHPPKNVLSAIQAKGLEFPVIILYKFGDQFAKEFKYSIWDHVRNLQNHSLELEYFFNKLYVAASRGIYELIIVDTQQGDENLWSFATINQQNPLKQWLQYTEQPQQWQDSIGGICWGKSWQGLEQDNRLDLAQEFKENGCAQNDSISLRRAKQFYIELNEIEEAQCCEAWALKFEKHYCQAGKLFLQWNQEIEAWQCFWEGLCWLELMEWYQQFPQKKIIERPLVDWMNSQKTVADLLELTQFIEQQLNTSILLENHFVKPWKVAVEDYAVHIHPLISTDALNGEDWQRVGQVLVGLDRAKYPKMLALAGECFYQANSFKAAVNCWQKTRKIDQKKYYLAQAELLGIPAGLPYLEKAKADERIIQEWENAGQPKTQPWLKFIHIIGQVLQRQNRQREWAEYLIKMKQWNAARAVIDGCSLSEAIPLKITLIRQLSRSSVSVEQLEKMRSRYTQLIDEVLTYPDWKHHLSMIEVGIALEKIGAFVPTLQFYSRYTDSQNLSLRYWSRKRWLMTQLKQRKYMATINPKIATRIAQEIAQWSQNWGICLSDISVDFPRLPGQHQNRMGTPPKIIGLPAHIPVTTLNAKIGVYSFQIGSLQVKWVKQQSTLWVFIQDRVNTQDVQIKVNRQQVILKLNQIKIEACDGSQLSFESPMKDYRGVISYGEFSPSIELDFQDLSNKVCF